MPHAETHTVILPHAVAYNAKGAENAIKIVARALAVDNAAQGLYDMAKNLGIPHIKSSFVTLLPCFFSSLIPLLLLPFCLIPAFPSPSHLLRLLPSLIHPC